MEKYTFPFSFIILFPRYPRYNEDLEVDDINGYKYT